MLSERLRNMRFMREVEEKDLRSKLEEEQKEREKATHWTLETEEKDEQDGTPIVIVEDAYTMPSSVEFAGRQSFGKFNLVVEKRNRGAPPLKEKVEREGNGGVKRGRENDDKDGDGDDDDARSNPVHGNRFKRPGAKKKFVDFRQLVLGKRTFNPTAGLPPSNRKKTKFQDTRSKR